MMQNYHGKSDKLEEQTSVPTKKFPNQLKKKLTKAQNGEEKYTQLKLTGHKIHSSLKVIKILKLQ